MFKRKYSNISGDPFKLEDDLPPCPKITKHDKVPPVQKVTSANNSWADKLCTHLNTCEWAQTASIKLLENIPREFYDNPVLSQTLSDLESCIDLLGEHLFKAVNAASAIKTNTILHHRDMFLGNIVNEVDSRLVKLARVQPVIQHPKLIGEPIKLMSDSLDVSNTQLANKAMAQVGSFFSTAALPRGGGNRSANRGNRKPQGKAAHGSRKSQYHKDTTQQERNREDKRRDDKRLKSLNEHKESYQSHRGGGSQGSRGSRGNRRGRGSNRGAGRGSDRGGSRGSFKNFHQR